MTKKYDLVIVGAGPGGAMAAKTAGENGLKTAILERKRNPDEITRGCAMMFAVEDDYYFGERMFFNEKNGNIIFPLNGFSVGYDGPVRNLYAWHFYAPDGLTRLEFGDYAESVTQGDGGRLSFVYDKGRLINGLMTDALRNGVDLYAGVNVEGLEKIHDGIRVIGGGETFEGRFVIGADGINSRIAELAGFNRDRKFFGSGGSITYYVRGMNIPCSEAAITACFCRPGYATPASFFMVPSVYAGDEYWINIRRVEDLDYIAQESVYAAWFDRYTIERRLAYVLSLRTPVAEPFKDNILLVGDAAWFAEAEITGSMMCGRKAANAVTVALLDNQPNRDGVISYIDWWQKSCPHFDDYRNFALLPVFFRHTFTREEMIYLYGLLKTPLQPTLNPFLIVRLVKKALTPMMETLRAEMPTIAEKIERLEIHNFEKLMSTKKENHME